MRLQRFSVARHSDNSIRAGGGSGGSRSSRWARQIGQHHRGKSDGLEWTTDTTVARSVGRRSSCQLDNQSGIRVCVVRG